MGVNFAKSFTKSRRGISADLLNGNGIGSGLLGATNGLLPSNRVFKHLNPEDSRDLGLETIPLQIIVGSSGRHLEFDLTFQPRRGKSERWPGIARADRDGLSPVSLYNEEDSYFVKDGNHRVSVARANGHESFEAFVIEIDASGLRPEPSYQRLRNRL